MSCVALAPTPAPAAELVFDVMRSAVTLARNEHITSTAILRVRLCKLWPQADHVVVDEALKLWAKSSKS